VYLLEDVSYLGNGLSPDLGFYLRSRQAHPVAADKSPTTVSPYLRGVDMYLRWCRDGGHPLELTRAQVQQCEAELTGKEPNTATKR
jgi:hypothetical protein